MAVLVRGGTVVNADRSFRADVLCDGGRIVAVGEGIEAPTGAETVDAGGAYVIPGGIDPHIHCQLEWKVPGFPSVFTDPAGRSAGRRCTAAPPP